MNGILISSSPSFFKRIEYRFTNRFGRSSTSTVVATVSVYSEPPTTQSSRRFGSGKINNNRRSRPSDSTSSSSSNSNSKSKEESTTPSINRRGFKPRVQASPVDSAQAASTSLYKFKLSRPSGRWQYKTTPKPRVTIRKGEEPAAENGPTTPLAEEVNIHFYIPFIFYIYMFLARLLYVNIIYKLCFIILCPNSNRFQVIF